MKRSVAREKVFKILFQYEFHSDFNEIMPRLVEEEELRGVQGEYAKGTINSIIANLEQIDGIITSHLKGWTFSRLGKHVIAILRLGVYELVFNPEIPNLTAIDEAVKLSYTYCDEKDAVFINGVLHTLLKQGKAKTKSAKAQRGEPDGS
ncbi:MAG: transcription antitermination factor NusB [Eubacteriaceae bacterium]|nr:transcription antitermination factor NusB [Eubacteriaceae bacterium]